MFQASNLQHLAVNQYVDALALAEANPLIFGMETCLHVTKESAHNLVLIYKGSGATDLALEVMMKYLLIQ